MAEGADTVTVEQLLDWFRRFAAHVEEQAGELTRLDSAIGDADHGNNLRRGCRAVVTMLDEQAPEDAAAFGKAIAMKLISSVGGASGPLYGSFFLAFGTAAGAHASLSPAQVADAWEAGVAAIQSRGKAQLEDKTMLDALLPATAALRERIESGEPLTAAFAAAVAAAEEGREATIPLQARKGRASYLGERSIGHQDPGATSSTLLITAASEALAS